VDVGWHTIAIAHPQIDELTPTELESDSVSNSSVKHGVRGSSIHIDIHRQPGFPEFDPNCDDWGSPPAYGPVGKALSGQYQGALQK
jgi:hypothetical protein